MDIYHHARFQIRHPSNYVPTFIALAAAVSLAVTGCMERSSDSPDASANGEGTTATTDDDVQLQILDYDGIQKLIHGHAGKLVVLDVWSTSCGPCVREFPNLVALSRKYPEQIACISVSFDYEGIGRPEDVQDKVLKFLRSQGARFDNVLSSVESDEMYKKFGIAAPPVVLVYDRDGQQIKRFDDSTGEGFTYDDVEKFLKQHLDQSQ